MSMGRKWEGTLYGDDLIRALEEEHNRVNIMAILGKRCLLQVGTYTARTVEEFRVLEVSPSGQWAKLMNLHGYKFWRPVVDVALVEVLTELRPAEARPRAADGGQP